MAAATGKKSSGGLAAKRRALELSHWENWLGQGRGRFHLEHIELVAVVLEKLLTWTSLLEPGLANARAVRLVTVDLAIPRLPQSFDGFTILFLSDLHIDALDGLTDALCQLLEGVEADICLLGGDYRFQVKGPCQNVYFEMERLLGSLDFPLGVVGVLGNHDFAEEAEELSRLGVEMLVNQAKLIKRGNERLWIMGLDDPHFYGCDDLEGAMEGVPEKDCKILLVHSPELWREALSKGIDLYLCGHTHAGQIKLPFIGAPLLNAACPRRLTEGAWSHGNMMGYTNRGAGSSMVPVRFNCQPEAALIVLHRANAKTG